jgi:hypothetical protein
MNELRKLVKDCLTENNGTSYDPFRVSGAALTAAGVPTFIGGALAQIFHGHFDPVQFAMAFATMLGGLAVLAGGVAIKAKTDTP